MRWLSGSLNTAAIRPVSSIARNTGSACGRDTSRRSRVGASGAILQPRPRTSVAMPLVPVAAKWIEMWLVRKAASAGLSGEVIEREASSDAMCKI